MEAGGLLAGEQHQRLGGQAAQRDAAQCGQGVADRDRGDRALAHHHLGAQVVADLDRRAHQPDVDHAGAERAQLLDGGALAQLDLDLGAAAAEALDDPGHDRQQRRADEVDPQQARLAGVDPPRGGHGDVELGQHRPGVAQERLAGRGQLDAAAGAGQQADAELLLQAGDLLAERGLGDVQAGGGAAEVKLLGDGDEVAQLAKFHESSDDGGDAQTTDTKIKSINLNSILDTIKRRSYRLRRVSFLLTCPNCGVREVTDFGFGGEISPRPKSRPSFRELNSYNYFRRNVAGVQREWWFHRSGCRAWFIAERDTVTNEVLFTACRRAPTTAPREPPRPAARRADRPRAQGQLHLRRQAGRGLRGRHDRLGAVRRRPAHLLAAASSTTAAAG